MGESPARAALAPAVRLRRWAMAAVFAGAAFGASDAAAVDRLTPVGAGTPVELVGASPDGARVVFTTTAALVPEDTDTVADVYVNAGGVLTLLSTGSQGGNASIPATGRGMSRDGTTVLFDTKEQLLPGDTDPRNDVYARDAGGLHLRSVGPQGGNADAPGTDVIYLKATEDGSEVYFRTNEVLTSGGTAGVYRAGSSGTLFLTGMSGQTADAFALSPTGDRILFEAGEPLGDDPDAPGATDVFSWNFTTPPELQSGGPLQNDTTFDTVAFRGASRNADRPVFATAIPLTSADDDDTFDLYQLTEWGTALLSDPVAPLTEQTPSPIPSFTAISESGGTVLWESDEAVTPGDADGKLDVFVNRVIFGSGSSTADRVSNGLTGGGGAFDATAAGLSADGTHAYFETAEGLVAADTDGLWDVYENDGFTTRLVSTGPADTGAAVGKIPHWVGASPDGARAYFTSAAQLTADDTDAAVDLYVREAGTTSLLSLGPAGGNGAFDVQARGVSPDGSKAYFRTIEGLSDGVSSGWNLYASGAPAVAPAGPGPGPGTGSAPGPVPPPGAVVDTLKPGISLALVKGQKLKTVLASRSIALRLGCSEACRVSAVASLAVAGKASAAKTVRLGTASATFKAKGSRVVKLKLTRAGRSALAKLRRTAKVKVAVTATDAAGNRATRNGQISLRR